MVLRRGNHNCRQQGTGVMKNNQSEKNSRPSGINRRRAITIMGAASAMALMPRGVGAKTAPHWRSWDGEVLGASSSIKLLGPDADAAI